MVSVEDDGQEAKDVRLAPQHWFCQIEKVPAIIHRTMTQTTGSLTCLSELLMHAYTHMFSLPLYLFRKTDWLLFSGGGDGGF